MRLPLFCTLAFTLCALPASSLPSFASIDLFSATANADPGKNQCIGQLGTAISSSHSQCLDTLTFTCVIVRDANVAQEMHMFTEPGCQGAHVVQFPSSGGWSVDEPLFTAYQSILWTSSQPTKKRDEVRNDTRLELPAAEPEPEPELEPVITTGPLGERSIPQVRGRSIYIGNLVLSFKTFVPEGGESPSDTLIESMMIGIRENFDDGDVPLGSGLRFGYQVVNLVGSALSREIMAEIFGWIAERARQQGGGAYSVTIFNTAGAAVMHISTSLTEDL